MIEFIHAHLPSGKSFIDLFGGSAVVTISVIGQFDHVVYNDINQRLVRFFRTLRDRSDELIEILDLTPAARQELAECWDVADDPVEDARRVFVLINQSFMKKGLWVRSAGWSTPGAHCGARRARSFRSAVGRLPKIAYLLSSVDIECRDFRKVAALGDENSVIFADPPYDITARSGGGQYTNEMSEQDHRDLALLLDASPSAALVCGYRSDLYDALYAHWDLKETDISCSTSTVRGLGHGRRTECLWIKPHNAVRQYLI
ncbi:MAG: DNA adenine methylase [Gammaproteobacteria bacterium AqS3]|nr:DNA adenine methylase [Gammaproteobacteria bacterium AqS3]